jgi:hypothetical protein
MAQIPNYRQFQLSQRNFILNPDKKISSEELTANDVKVNISTKTLFSAKKSLICSLWIRMIKLLLSL